MNWYLLQTKPNAHKTACENLRRQNFDVFLPFIIKTMKKRDKFLDVKVPLFPGYLFFNTCIEPIPWKSINGTRGVSSVVTLDGVYRPINVQIIEGLKSRCYKNGVFKHLDELASGDRAKIEKGPFADFICTVQDISDERRAWVLIDLLERQVKAEVSVADMSKRN